MGRISHAPISKCPYCGSDYGYYTKEHVTGSVMYNYHFDGSEADNGEMYDNLRYSGGKWAYCFNCDKRLFKMEE